MRRNHVKLYGPGQAIEYSFCYNWSTHPVLLEFTTHPFQLNSLLLFLFLFSSFFLPHFLPLSLLFFLASVSLCSRHDQKQSSPCSFSLAPSSTTRTYPCATGIQDSFHSCCTCSCTVLDLCQRTRCSLCLSSLVLQICCGSQCFCAYGSCLALLLGRRRGT